MIIHGTRLRDQKTDNSDRPNVPVSVQLQGRAAVYEYRALLKVRVRMIVYLEMALNRRIRNGILTSLTISGSASLLGLAEIKRW